jgi:hypothetical protein
MSRNRDRPAARLARNVLIVANMGFAKTISLVAAGALLALAGSAMASIL